MDDIYLCVSCNKDITKRDFTCQKFDSYTEANEFFKTKVNSEKDIIPSTMIPINKFMPNIIRDIILERQINILWSTTVKVIDNNN